MELCGQWLGLRSSCPPPPPRLPSPLALISPNHFELFPLRLIPLCFSKLPPNYRSFLSRASIFTRARFAALTSLQQRYTFRHSSPPPLHPSPSIPPFPTLTFLSSFPSFIAEKCFMHSNTRVIFVRQHFRRNRERDTHTHKERKSRFSSRSQCFVFGKRERHTNTS